MPPLASIPGVVDVLIVRGEHAGRGARDDREGAPEEQLARSARIDLLVEVPHGATRTEDYRALEQQLVGPLPPALIDFFYVNTDAGAYELAEAVARGFAIAEPGRTVAVLRCRIPRTFIDCNRRIDARSGGAAGAERAREIDQEGGPEQPPVGREAKVTPGLMPWITAPADRALLRERYDAYVAAVGDAAGRLAPDGAMLMLHSYAPRSVDVEVDLDIVAKLRRAWQSDVEPTWPLRPELDVIGRGVDGVSYAPAAVVGALRDALAGRGIAVADSATYPLHPSTLAWDHVTRLPGRALCLEVRRDLLADPFEPFAEMRISPDKVARLAAPLTAALRRWW